MHPVLASWTLVAAALTALFTPAPLPAPAAAPVAVAGVRAGDPGPTPVPAGAARIVLHAGAAPGPLDVEVLAAVAEGVVFLERGRLDPAEPMSVDVPMGAADRYGVHVRAQPAGSLFALPEVFSESVPLERGRTHTLTVAPSPHPRRPGAACGSTTPLALGGQQDHYTKGTADIDGDGDHERAAVWSEGEGDARRWLLGVQGPEPPGRTMVTSPLPPPPGFDPDRPGSGAELTGVADVDADGADDLVVTTGHGGHTRDVQLWGLRGCALTPATIEGRPGPATFPVGASATSKAGLSCFYLDAPTVTAWRADVLDGERFAITITEHRWRAPGVLDPGVTTSWTTPRTDRWTLLEASGLRCGRPPFTLAQAIVPAVAGQPSFTG